MEFDFFQLLIRCDFTNLGRGYSDVFILFFLLVDSKIFFQWSFESFSGKHKAPHIIKSAFLD